MNTYRLLFTGLLLLLSLQANSQETSNQNEQIMLPIMSLFDGMRESDAPKVRSAFASQAIIHRAHSSLREDTTVDNFAKAVASKGDAIWDEKIWDIQINTEDNLASVWTQFGFVLNGSLSHCGVNSFQLYKFEDGWKIIYLVDTFRQDNCVIPAEAH